MEPTDWVAMLGCTLAGNTAHGGCGGGVHVSMRDAVYAVASGGGGSLVSAPPWRALLQGGSMANNSALHGGAVCVEAAGVSSSVSLAGLPINSNVATQDGGGAVHVLTDCRASVSFSAVNMSGNKALAGDGGAVSIGLMPSLPSTAVSSCARANVALSGGRLDNNAASHGGAVHLSANASARLTGVTLERNAAALGGGVAGTNCTWLELQVRVGHDPVWGGAGGCNRCGRGSRGACNRLEFARMGIASVDPRM